MPAVPQYAEGWEQRQYPGLAEKLLWKSATLHGFFLLHYASIWRRHLKKLAGLLSAGQLRVQVRQGVQRGATVVLPLLQQCAVWAQVAAMCSATLRTARHGCPAG